MFESGLSRADRARRATQLLDLVGLRARMDFLPNQLSGGERQRVAIARALSNRPAIILADEPTGNLDTHTTEDIMRLLAELNRAQGTTLIVVTHNHEVACTAQRVITLRDGKIQHDVALATEFERSLLDFKSSALGQAVLRDEGLPEELRTIAPQLRSLLERV